MSELRRLVRSEGTVDDMDVNVLKRDMHNAD